MQCFLNINIAAFFDPSTRCFCFFFFYFIFSSSSIRNAKMRGKTFAFRLCLFYRLCTRKNPVRLQILSKQKFMGIHPYYAGTRFVECKMNSTGFKYTTCALFKLHVFVQIWVTHKWCILLFLSHFVEKMLVHNIYVDAHRADQLELYCNLNDLLFFWVSDIQCGSHLKN